MEHITVDNDAWASLTPEEKKRSFRKIRVSEGKYCYAKKKCWTMAYFGWQFDNLH